ncbi:hypothetical protein VIN01S_11220 [Vibrio inusitatus NBRC 102082]|uniref:Uncharacterized protein n=1 Tax=Vibrio inusitatus NBRC 102082 TaxID=1219070 RepID=A0A4Y3HTE3_9VIBR|nr:hypothetical protein [Vibrio inusitatus]GEA50318.1 hypothetical protein VIN01S_11220 [Vibrio inusitatus NBRC 102082]
MKSTARLLLVTLLFPFKVLACAGLYVIPGETIPSETFNVQASVHTALEQGLFEVDFVEYAHKAGIVLFQLQSLINQMPADEKPFNGEFYLYETSNGHYYRFGITKGKVRFENHKVPVGTVIDSSIVTDIDVLSSVIQGDITVQQAINANILIIPDSSNFVVPALSTIQS